MLGEQRVRSCGEFPKSATGLCLLAYHTNHQYRPVKTVLKATATPSIPHRTPTRKAPTHTGAETSAKLNCLRVRPDEMNSQAGAKLIAPTNASGARSRKIRTTANRLR